MFGAFESGEAFSGRSSQIAPGQVSERSGAERMAANLTTEAAKAAAMARAEGLRPLFAEVAHLGVRRAAEELNRRKVRTPTGRRWHPMTVLRVRKRLQRASGT